LLAPQRGLTATGQNQNPRPVTAVRIGERGQGMGKADSRSCKTSTATPAEPGDLLTEFDNGARVDHLLKMSGVILQDYMVAQIIKKLERAQWKAVLQQAKKNPVIFTSAGFESLTA
jgi:hypothetical protein